MRKIHISNEAKRDAEVAFGTTFRRTTPVYKTASGSTGKNERRLKATMATTDAALLATYGEGLTDALISGDPEVDMERLGLKLEGLKKVFITREQKVAYGVSLNEHVYLPDGTEKEVRPKSATSANIALEGVPLRWTGKLIPIARLCECSCSRRATRCSTSTDSPTTSFSIWLRNSPMRVP